MNFLWILLGIIGALVLFLVFNDDGGTGQALGLPNSQFAQVALMSMWGAIIAAAIIPRQGNLKVAARNAAIWLILVIVLVGGYVLRDDLQTIASRVTGGLIPGSPVSIQTADGREQIAITASSNGHFLAKTNVNGASIRMLVDTGASSIVLSNQDAQSIGIDTSTLSFSTPVSTANGQAWTARIRIDVFELGSIRRERLTALVSEPGDLNESLLGMNFLNSLTAFEFRGDKLYLTD